MLIFRFVAIHVDPLDWAFCFFYDECLNPVPWHSHSHALAALLIVAPGSHLSTTLDRPNRFDHVPSHQKDAKNSPLKSLDLSSNGARFFQLAHPEKETPARRRGGLAGAS